MHRAPARGLGSANRLAAGPDPESGANAWCDGIDRDQSGKGLGESVMICSERCGFIMSGGVTTVGDFCRTVLAHWGIESTHVLLGVTFRLRKDQAARDLSLLRKISPAMLRFDTAYSTSSASPAPQPCFPKTALPRRTRWPSPTDESGCRRIICMMNV